jgi:FixJ family two-component response regulator
MNSNQPNGSAPGHDMQIMNKDFQMKEGVNFLTKPFQALKLAQTIRDCLDVQTPKNIGE